MCIFCTPDAPFSPLHLTDAEALRVERCPNLASRVPVSIVTGFLGAGKTTLINWLLKGCARQISACCKTSLAPCRLTTR